MGRSREQNKVHKQAQPKQGITDIHSCVVALHGRNEAVSDRQADVDNGGKNDEGFCEHKNLP